MSKVTIVPIAVPEASDVRFGAVAHNVDAGNLSGKPL